MSRRIASFLTLSTSNIDRSAGRLVDNQRKREKVRERERGRERKREEEREKERRPQPPFSPSVGSLCHP
jgi:hypothetical protein